MGTKTRFEKEANSNSEMAYCTHTTPASKKGNGLAYLHLYLNLASVYIAQHRSTKADCFSTYALFYLLVLDFFTRQSRI